MTLQDIRHAASEALAAAARVRWVHFLADVRQAHLRLTILQLYDLSLVLPEVGYLRTHRLAVVRLPHSPHAADLRLLETVFLNRGYTARLFPEPAPALAWLDGLRGQPAEQPAPDGPRQTGNLR